MKETNETVSVTENDAKMDAAREQAALQEQIRALEDRENALNRREREGRCREALREKQLPDALLSCLDLSTDERAEETLETMAGVFSTALREQLQARLGGEPPRVSSAVPADPLAAVRAAMGLE